MKKLWSLYMVNFYPIYEIDEFSYEAEEAMGTKSKFWYDDSEYLFKEGREGTGENWAEKIASELICLLELPHAEYDFADYKGKQGTRSKNFIPEDGALIHGNELLSIFKSDYDATLTYSQREHTARLVMALLKNHNPPVGYIPTALIKDGSDLFVGYLLFDAWISNTDRHHENWGVVGFREGGELCIYLTPSFDHASSLGCRECTSSNDLRLI